MDNSKIEWTDHTFNPWWGCVKVSAGCKNCYAEALDNRWKGGHWGPGSSRRAMSEQYWSQPLKWNKTAAAAGVPAKVFCASMADVFEGHLDTLPHLNRLFALIHNTPFLIWQLLTKRPENIMQLVPDLWRNHWPSNVWIGTSVENQEAADRRIPYLIQVPAAVRFLSCEPLLGPVTLFYNDEGVLRGPGVIISGGVSTSTPDYPAEGYDDSFSGIDWVIAGGESGHSARPVHPDWVRSLRDQCAAADVPFFFKQWGEWYTRWWTMGDHAATFKMYNSYQHFVNKDWVNKGDACISIDGRLCKIGQDFQGCAYPVAIMQRVGKKAAGRLLDGVEHNAFPKL